jgi:K+/H+ antiporter YhaU regulatory subunit KhtT
MAPEKIKVRTETGQVLEVVVYSKHAGSIQVVIGTGEHSMKCTLSPTRNEMAYVGSIMGREIVYERSRAQVQADIERLNPNVRPSRPR